jgi:hypothetical protein
LINILNHTWISRIPIFLLVNETNILSLFISSLVHKFQSEKIRATTGGMILLTYVIEFNVIKWSLPQGFFFPTFG